MLDWMYSLWVLLHERTILLPYIAVALFHIEKKRYTFLRLKK